MLPLLPLQLSAKRKSWRLADSHASESDSAFQAVRKTVLERDDYGCRFCAFKVSPTKTGASWQDVHHLDDDHGNNDPTNLVTACCLCHQCFHLGLAGSKRGGILIYLPEIGQAELHHISRAIFIAIATKSPFADHARSLFAAFESRQMHLEESIARGASNPSYMGQAFLSMTDEQYDKRMDALRGVRLLPYPERFQEQISFWVDHVYKDLHPETWDSLLVAFGGDDIAEPISNLESEHLTALEEINAFELERANDEGSGTN